MNYPIIKITTRISTASRKLSIVFVRELRYLAFTEAPPRETTVTYVEQNLAENWPHFIALDGEKVIGWCDIASLDKPVLEHSDVLGLGVIWEFRGHWQTPHQYCAAAAKEWGAKPDSVGGSRSKNRHTTL
ncbi:MAG: hypothetical protein PHY16_06005 [Methylobacter sp.]|nr:hypothetical protein [Methylobacter sp.]